MHTIDSDKPNRNVRTIFIFAVSVLLNVAGWMSLVDGLIKWASFFQNFLGVYASTIESLFSIMIFVFSFALPFDIPLPPDWAQNTIIIVGTLMIAHTQASKAVWGQSVFRHIGDVATKRYRQNGVFGAWGLFSVVPYAIRMLFISPLRPHLATENTIRFVKSFWFIVGFVLLLLFIAITLNFQVHSICATSSDDWANWLVCSTAP